MYIEILFCCVLSLSLTQGAVCTNCDHSLMIPKIINVAFAVSASFVLGDHLGFTAGFNQEMIFPMIVAKLVGGITAVILAMFIAKKTLGKIEEAK